MKECPLVVKQPDRKKRHFSVAGAAPPQALPAVFGSVGSLHTLLNCETKQTNNLSVVRANV